MFELVGQVMKLYLVEVCQVCDFIPQVGHDLLVLLEDIFTPLALKKECQAKL